MNENNKDRIGFYAGTFNPVHSGHISFALQALKAADLERLYFLPERRPRHKNGIEHFAHRTAMIKAAIKPHSKFSLLELVDTEFTVKRTLPSLQKIFPNKQFVFLFGSDAIRDITSWSYINNLFKSSEIIIGLRNNDDKNLIEQNINSWLFIPKKLMIIKSDAPDVSSTIVRQAIASRYTTKGLLYSVASYSNRHWLYVSIQ